MIHSLPLPTLQRANNLFVMSEFIYIGFKKGELESINQCRIYLQVITLTDIATADGMGIDETYMGPMRHKDWNSTLQWPTQHCPSPGAWQQWRRALQYLLYKGKFRVPLGQWQEVRPHQNWSWVVRCEDNVLFHWHSNGWVKYHPVGSRRHRATRAAVRIWYSQDDASPSGPPEGDTAAVTPVYDVMDDPLFTILKLEVLPSKRTSVGVEKS